MTRAWLRPLLSPLLLAAACLPSVGCVERVLIVRSDPPDAEVFVDGELRGKTSAARPLEIPFEHYGTRTLTLRSPGCLPLRQDVRLEVPWYQIFPLDLFSEVLWPGTIRDEHPVQVELERRGPPEESAKLEREARHFGTQEAKRP